jgi:hypothetical protein
MLLSMQQQKRQELYPQSKVKKLKKKRLVLLKSPSAKILKCQKRNPNQRIPVLGLFEDVAVPATNAPAKLIEPYIPKYNPTIKQQANLNDFRGVCCPDPSSAFCFSACCIGSVFS